MSCINTQSVKYIAVTTIGQYFQRSPYVYDDSIHTSRYVSFYHIFIPIDDTPSNDY